MANSMGTVALLTEAAELAEKHADAIGRMRRELIVQQLGSDGG